MFNGFKNFKPWLSLVRFYVGAKYRYYHGSTQQNDQEDVVLGQDGRILSVKNLDMHFKAPHGGVKTALSGINFDVNAKDFFGIIGESGSGKTTVGRCIMRMYNPTSGTITIGDKLFSNPHLSSKDRAWFHKNVQMIFQDPSTSVNPVKSIYSIVSEPLIINGLARSNTVDFINLINRTKWYFQYSYHKFAADVLLSDQIKYYQSLIDASKRLNTKLANFDFARFDNYAEFNDYVIDRVRLYNNRVTNAMEHIEHFTKSQTQFFYDCEQKIKNLDLEEYDLKLEQLNLSKKELIEKQCNMNPRFLVKKRLVELQKAFLDRKQEVHHFYDQVIMDVKQSYLAKISAILNAKKQAATLEIEEFVQQKIYALEEHMHHLLRNTLKIFFAPKYLNELEVDKIFRFVSSRFVDLFDKEFVKLEAYSREFCSTSDLARKQEIIKTVRHMKFVASHVYGAKIIEPETYLAKIFASDVTLLNLLHSKLERIIALSLQRKSAYNLEFKNYQTEISKIKQELKQFPLISIKSLKLQKTFKKKMQNIKRQIRDISIMRDNFVYKLTNSERGLLENTNQQKAKLKELKYEAKRLDQINNYLLRNVSRTQSRYLAQKEGMGVWERQRFINTNRNLYKNLSQAWKTRKSITQQLNLILRRIGMVSFIFRHSKFVSWCFYFFVRKALLLDRVYQALDEVGLKHEFAHRYPHEFSGGQLQRIVIARALITNPKIIIADEAISSLDVSIQSRVVKIMQDLCRQKEITFLFIAHDLSMVNCICNRLIIMHNGHIVEKGDTKKIFANPSHIYTKSLMKAIPELASIDKDLANVNEQDLLYANEYTDTNFPSFHCINNDPDHEVFATSEQIARWNQQ